jgi:hypothetical protein
VPDSSETFAAKFRLVLKVLNMSRGRAAFDLAVDKSLVGRWASGSVRPSEHNLARITTFIAQRRAGFSMRDWELDFPAFARLFDVTLEAAAPSQDGMILPGIPSAFLDRCREATARRGRSYEGFWQTTRPSVIMEGRLFHDRGMIRIGKDGFLEVGIGGGGLLFEGPILLAEGNLFLMLYDSVGGTPIFLIFKGVALPKAHILDGLLLFASLNAVRAPAAVPVLLERIGDLTGDREADEARYQELLNREPVPEPGAVPDSLIAYLIRDFGPAAAAAGGDMFLTAAAQTLSRGTTASGQLRG